MCTLLKSNQNGTINKEKGHLLSPDCGCHGYAASCVYDAVKGYGVCQDCTGNTIGDKCKFCAEFYTINPGNLTELLVAGETCTVSGCH